MQVQTVSADLPFACGRCGSSYKTASQLQVHFESRHIEDQPFVCGQCHLRFSTTAQLQSHLESKCGGIKIATYSIEFDQRQPRRKNAGQENQQASVKIERRLSDRSDKHSSDENTLESEAVKEKTQEIQTSKDVTESHSHRKELICYENEQQTINEKETICENCKQPFLDENGGVFQAEDTDLVTEEKHLFCSNCVANEELSIKTSNLSESISESSVANGTAEDKELFKCKHCNKVYKTKKSLKSHYKLHTKAYQCDYCQTIFRSRARLNAHLLTHTKEKPFLCDFDSCGKSYALNSDLTIHKRIHTGEKPFPCSTCAKAFTSSGALTKHRRTHTNPNHKKQRFQCDVCKNLVYSEKSLQVHDNSTTGYKLWICKKCISEANSLVSVDSLDNIFPSKDNKQQQNEYFCNQCDKFYATKKNLEVHQRLHTGEKLVQCKECNKPFTSASRLKAHMRVHTKEKPFECHKCGKCFGHRGTLTIHERTHTGNKPFQCDQCEKSFYASNAYHRHRLIHSNEKPFMCETCAKSFSSLPQLKKHQKSHVESEKKQVFQCKVCGKAFSHKCTLSSHERRHTGLRQYQCHLCPKAFFDSSILNKHKKTHTKPYTCVQCGKACSSTSHLKMHRETHTRVRELMFCDICKQSFSSYKRFNKHCNKHVEIVK